MGVNAGSFVTTSSNGRSLTFKWSLSSQNFLRNTSTISWQLVGSGTESGWVNCGPFEVVVQGEVVYSSSTRVQVYQDTIVANGTLTLDHNGDGTKYFSAKVTAAIFSYSNNCSGSGGWELPQIPVLAKITDADNFSNLDGSPTMWYSNPSGNGIAGLQGCITLYNTSESGGMITNWIDLPKTAGSYTFSLTSYQRKTIMEATTTDSVTVRFYIRSKQTANGLWSEDAVSRTFTIHGEYLISEGVAFTDIAYNDITSFTEDRTQLPIIRLVSETMISFSNLGTHLGFGGIVEPATIKWARSGSRYIGDHPNALVEEEGVYSTPWGGVHHGDSYDDQYCIFYGLESNTVEIAVESFRGTIYTRTFTVPAAKYVDYALPEIYGISGVKITTSGQLIMNHIRMQPWSGKIHYPYNYAEDYNTRQCTLTVQYKLHGATSWSTAGVVYVGKTNTDYEFVGEIANLDYRASYDIRVQLKPANYKIWSYSPNIELIDNYLSVREFTIGAQPVFDWGRDDFNFNVPVTIKGRQYGVNEVLWSGGWYMTAAHTVTFSNPVNQQPHGIVLVFSPYVNGAVADYDFHSFFVPKELIIQKGGSAHSFNMMSHDYTRIGSKSLYIGDTQIVGHADNSKSGTTNGITFNNNAYVLRYVIGV